MDKLNKRIQFIIEIDKMKNIFRRNLLVDGSRRENDAEHSWHLATCALVLFDYAPAGVDLSRVLQMALIHDLVEIDAGDTFAYDTVGYQDKEERETAAADRVFGMLPAEQGAYLRALWEEFDAVETPDAIFASAMDRFQPLLNNYMTQGHTWKMGNVHKPLVLERLEPLKQSCPEVYAYAEELIEDSIKKGYLQP